MSESRYPTSDTAPSTTPNDEDRKGVWLPRWMLLLAPTAQAAIVLAELAWLEQPGLRGSDRIRCVERRGVRWLTISDADLGERIGLSAQGVRRAREALKRAKLLETTVAKVEGVRCCHLRLVLPESEGADKDSETSDPTISQASEATNEPSVGSDVSFPSSDLGNEERLERVADAPPSLLFADSNGHANGKTATKKARETPIGDHFTVTPEMRAWASTDAPSVDIDSETAKFADHARAKGSTYIDWGAAWRNWLRKAVEYSAPRQSSAPNNGYRVSESGRVCE